MKFLYSTRNNVPLLINMDRVVTIIPCKSLGRVSLILENAEELEVDGSIPDIMEVIERLHQSTKAIEKMTILEPPSRQPRPTVDDEEPF